MSTRGDLKRLRVKLEETRPWLTRTSTDIPHVQELANVLAPLLTNAHGQLQSELERLWQFIAGTPHPKRAIFAIKPNTSIAEQARMAWLQVLVMATQAFSEPPQRIPPVRRGLKLGRLEELQASARRNWEDLVVQHGPKYVLDLLIEALQNLSACLHKRLELDGETVFYCGRRLGLRLSPQERVFLRALIDRGGKPVSGQYLRRQGINHLKKLKSRLVNKDRTGTLRDCILSDRAGGYRLHMS